MRKRLIKGSLLASFVFSAALFALAFVPHHACACGQYEDGSQLTHIINTVSETLIGKPLIEKNPSPFK